MNKFLYSSEFRRNQHSDDIVYYSESMDVFLRVTKEQFLAENPGLTDQDFTFYQAWSDNIFYEFYKHDRREGRNHCPLDEELAGEERSLHADDWMDYSDLRQDLAAVLTPKQYRRFVLYFVHGLSAEKIARMEGCTQQSIACTIEQIRKKLKNIF